MENVAEKALAATFSISSRANLLTRDGKGRSPGVPRSVFHLIDRGARLPLPAARIPPQVGSPRAGSPHSVYLRQTVSPGA